MHPAVFICRSRGRAVRAWCVPPTLRGYRAAWLGADALAGLSLMAVALPSQMATAVLANMPVVAGLFAFVAGSLLYAVLGRNRHLSVGADSTIAPVLATGVASIAVVGTAGYVTAMAFTALLVGAVLIAVGLFRLGWIAEFLSTPVIAGVLAGIAVEIIVRQIPVILGIPAGTGSTIDRLHHVVTDVGQVNGWSLLIALGVLTVIIAFQRVSRRLPGALIALVVSVIAVKAFGLSADHGVALVGAVHGGLPRVRLPTVSWSQLRRLPAPVLTVAFLCIAQTAASVRSARSATADVVGFNRDLVAIGAGSLGAGMIGSFAVDASPPNSAVSASAGSRSQLTNIFAALAVLVVVLAFSGALADIPEATLGATLVFIAAKLFRVGELRAILRFDRLEFALATITLLVVALVGIEQGVLAALILSLADRTRRSARPQDAVLGREPGTDHWVPLDVGQPTEQVPGILVYLVDAPLWYGNADYLRVRIGQLVEGSPEPVKAVILDAGGISDIDYTGLQALRSLALDLERRGTVVAVARASKLVHHDLKHGALLEQLGRDHLFASVDEGVVALCE